jgi:hypothetical protein
MQPVLKQLLTIGKKHKFIVGSDGYGPGPASWQLAIIIDSVIVYIDLFKQGPVIGSKKYILFVWRRSYGTHFRRMNFISYGDYDPTEVFDEFFLAHGMNQDYSVVTAEELCIRVSLLSCFHGF